MKFLIWFICFLGLAITQMIIQGNGVVLGGIPTAILFALTFWIAQKMCQKWDAHVIKKKAVSNNSGIIEPFRNLDNSKVIQQRNVLKHKVENSSDYFPSDNVEGINPKRVSEHLPRSTTKKSWFTWIMFALSVCVIILCLIQISYYQQTIEELENTVSELNDTIEQKDQQITSWFWEYEKHRSLYMQASLTLYFYENHIVFISENDSKFYHIYGCPLFDRTDPFWACDTGRINQYTIIPCEECCK